MTETEKPKDIWERSFALWVCPKCAKTYTHWYPSIYNVNPSCHCEFPHVVYFMVKVWPQCSSLLKPHDSAVPLLSKQIARLKTHREMWKRSGGLLATLPSDGQIQIIIEQLERAVETLNKPEKP